MSAPSLFEATDAREVTRQIVFHRADPNARNDQGESPLHCALRRQGALPVIKEIVRLGGWVNKLNGEGNSPAFLAAWQHPDIAVLDFLLDVGADIDGPRRSYSPLHAAVFNDYMDKVNLLLARGADPNKPGRAGETPLFACHDSTMARRLIEAGADPYKRDFAGRTAIDWWRERGLEDTLTVLTPAKPPRLRVVGGRHA